MPMSASSKLVERINDLVRARNRELATDAALNGAFGVGFCAITFGMLYGFGWVLGFMFARSVDLEAWQFGLLVSGLFFSVAVWSAWRRVDPLEGLRPLSDQQRLLLLASQALGGPGFSPRHASAGLAVVLIGGPASLFSAVGIWAHRVRADEAAIKAAAQLLDACQVSQPIDSIRNAEAALLLKRLALIKVLPNESSHVVTATQKGMGLVSKAGKKGKASSG